MTIFDEVDEQVARIAREEERLAAERERAIEREYAIFLERLGELLTEDDRERLQLVARHHPSHQLHGLATFTFDGRDYGLYYSGSAQWCFFANGLDDTPSGPWYAATREDFIRGLALLRRSR